MNWNLRHIFLVTSVQVGSVVRCVLLGRIVSILRYPIVSLWHHLRCLWRSAHSPLTTFNNFASCAVCNAIAMLFALMPPSIEAPAISPCKNTEALFLVIGVLSTERPAIGP